MNLRPAIIVILAILLFRSPAFPLQSGGQHQDNRQWNTLSTRHFDVHYPAGLEPMAIMAAEIAESGYIRVSNSLRHDITAIIPVQIYPAGQESRRYSYTGIQYHDVDPSRTRFDIVVHFNGSYADLKRSIIRGLTHAFIYSIAGEKPWHLASFRSVRLPYWLQEGLARYMACGFDGSAVFALRDSIKISGFPGISVMNDFNDGRADAMAAAGQAFCYFMDTRFGMETLGEMVKELLDTGLIDDAVYASTGEKTDDLNREWIAFLGKRYNDGESPLEKQKIDNHLLESKVSAMIPAVSPDGKKIAALCEHNGSSDLVLFEFSGGPHPVLRKSKTLLRGSRCVGLVPSSPAINRLSWTPDSRSILMAGRVNDRQYIVFLDAATGRVIYARHLPFSVIKDPSLSHDGMLIAFSGVAATAEDIYILDRNKNTVTRITDDDFSDRFPVITDDGGSILFSTNWNPAGKPDQHVYRIHHIIIKTGRRTEVVGGGGNGIHASLSLDGNKLLYVAERQGSRRICIYDLDTKSISRLQGDTATCSNPRWIIGSGSFVSTIHKNNRDIIIMGLTDRLVPCGPISHEPDTDPSQFQESYVNPGEYSFHLYMPKVQPGWVHLCLAGSMHNSYLGYVQAGLEDYLGKHRIILDAAYTRGANKNDINAVLAYRLKIQRAILGFGIFRQSNPLVIHSPGEVSWFSIHQPFGIKAMEHYGGRLSARIQAAKHISVSFSASSGRFEKEYRSPDTRHDLRITFGKLSCAVEYDTERRGLMTTVSGSKLAILAEHAFDFTGSKSFTRIGIDFRHHFLLNRQFILFLRGSGATLAGNNRGGFRHYLGGFGSLRGYELNSVSGRNMFLLNAELWFTPLDWVTFGLPMKGGLGNIGFVIFFDAGSAWSGIYRFVDKKTGRLDDLKMDFGAGVRMAVAPLIFLKLDFAWPFDNKSIRQTNMMVNIGFDF